MTINYPLAIHIAIMSAFAAIMIAAITDTVRQLRRPVRPFSKGE